MVIEQIVDIPASHRLVLDVPREIPAGVTILTFTPRPAAHLKTQNDDEAWKAMAADRTREGSP